jgi:hypothetical protein
MVGFVRPYLVALAAAVVFVGGCTIERADVRTPSGEPPEADTARVRKAIEAFALAFQTGDLAPLDTIYHESVTVYEDGRLDQGWLQYRDQHLLPEIAALTRRQLQFEDITVRLSGVTAWATCRYGGSCTRIPPPARPAADPDRGPIRGIAWRPWRTAGGRDLPAGTR